MNTKHLAAVVALWLLVPAGEARAQDQDIEERQITLVGCVMREHEYRDTYGPGLSGPRGPGIGGRDEYMLVDAREVGASTADVTATCPPTPGTFPTAYELTGSREGELEAFVGRRVELTGMQKEANARPVGASGTLRPTGGFDPLGHELHLVEVEVASFRQPAPPRAEAPPPSVAPPARAEVPDPAPEPPVPAPAPEVAVAEPSPRPTQERQIEEPPQQVARLPRTASPLPLAGLIGLLSLAAAAGVRAYRSRA